MPAVQVDSITDSMYLECCNDSVGCGRKLNLKLHLTPEPIQSTPEEIAKGWPDSFLGARFDLPYPEDSQTGCWAVARNSFGVGPWSDGTYIPPQPVPEPTVLIQLLVGILGLVFLGRAKNKIQRKKIADLRIRV